MAFSFDKSLGRYRAPSGRFLAEREVRGVVDTVLMASGDRVRALSARLRSGDLALADWQAQMLREVKVAHVVAATAAKGGWSAMTPGEWGVVGQSLRQQYQYLNAFAADVASGRQPLNGRLDARAVQYTEHARTLYEDVRRREGQDRGVVQERRLRHVTDSCPGCVEQAALGWQPAGVLAPIGTQDCRGNCKCTWQVRTVRDLMEAA